VGVTLVPLDRLHLERTRSWANDPELMRRMDRVARVTEDEHEAWFAALATRSDCAYFAIEQGDERRHVGNAWLWAIDRRHRKAELRIVVGDASARGRGVGAQAIDLLCRYGFEQLHLHRVYAYVLAVNPAARRAFEKAGFVAEGTLKDDRTLDAGFCDVYLLARLAAAENRMAGAKP
jgi:RimJ/RimL family protein N-acetyltransferase